MAGSYYIDEPTPRVSLIIACLNPGATLGRCLDSVGGQDYAEIEAIVVDGGSTDGTIDAIRGRAAHFGKNLVWLSEPDEGIADAWNKAVARITGSWVLFLGADDVLASATAISQVVRHLRRAGPSHRVVYGRVLVTDADGARAELLGRPWSAHDFRTCRYNLPHQGVFHHRSLFDDGATFDTSYAVVADFDFLLRELKRAEPLYLPDLIVCKMQRGGISNNPLQAPRGVVEQLRLYRSHVGGISLVLYWDLAKAWIKSTLYRLGGDPLVFAARNAYSSLVHRRLSTSGQLPPPQV
jgi:glycosyltransferase involved in cell wall biosynthesis